jgi:hypothetical protein
LLTENKNKSYEYLQQWKDLYNELSHISSGGIKCDIWKYTKGGLDIKLCFRANPNRLNTNPTNANPTNANPTNANPTNANPANALK